MTEIPAYQAVDIIRMGEHLPQLKPPERGYVVTFPDNGIDTAMLPEEEATDELLQQLKAKSKWPDLISFRPAWIHTQEVIFGDFSERRHWTPR